MQVRRAGSEREQQADRSAAQSDSRCAAPRGGEQSLQVLEDLAELRTFHGGLYNAMKKSVKEMRSIKAIVLIQVRFQLRLR